MLSLVQRPLTSALLQYLKKYLVNTKADLNLSLFGGDAVLNEVELNLPVLSEELGIRKPYSLTRGFVKKLRIGIEWSLIVSSPVKLTIQCVEITVSRDESVFNRTDSLGSKKGKSADGARRSGRTGVGDSDHEFADGSDTTSDHTSPKPADPSDFARESMDGMSKGSKSFYDSRATSGSSSGITGGGIGASSSSSSSFFDLTPVLMRIAANINIEIEEVRLTLNDLGSGTSIVCSLGKLSTFATDPNWRRLPWMDFLTSWKLSHRVFRASGLKVECDAIKSRVREEPLISETDFEVRVKSSMHWFWHGGRPPPFDPANFDAMLQDYLKDESTDGDGDGGSSITDAIFSTLSGRSGRSRRSVATGGTSKKDSGASVRSVGSFGSGGGVSAKTTDSRLALATDDTTAQVGVPGSLGPVLSVDVLVQNTMDVQLSCFQLGMLSVLTSHLTGSLSADKSFTSPSSRRGSGVNNHASHHGKHHSGGHSQTAHSRRLSRRTSAKSIHFEESSSGGSMPMTATLDDSSGSVGSGGVHSGTVDSSSSGGHGKSMDHSRSSSMTGATGITGGSSTSGSGSSWYSWVTNLVGIDDSAHLAALASEKERLIQLRESHMETPSETMLLQITVPKIKFTLINSRDSSGVMGGHSGFYFSRSGGGGTRRSSRHGSSRVSKDDESSHHSRGRKSSKKHGRRGRHSTKDDKSSVSYRTHSTVTSAAKTGISSYIASGLRSVGGSSAGRRYRHYPSAQKPKLLYKSYTVSCFSFAEIEVSGVSVNVVRPMVPAYHSFKQRTFKHVPVAPKKEHLHRSVIVELQRACLFDISDSRLCPLLVWGRHRDVSSQFEFVGPCVLDSKPDPSSLYSVPPGIPTDPPPTVPAGGGAAAADSSASASSVGADGGLGSSSSSSSSSSSKSKRSTRKSKAVPRSAFQISNKRTEKHAGFFHDWLREHGDGFYRPSNREDIIALRFYQSVDLNGIGSPGSSSEFGTNGYYYSRSSHQSTADGGTETHRRRTAATATHSGDYISSSSSSQSRRILMDAMDGPPIPTTSPDLRERMEACFGHLGCIANVQSTGVAAFISELSSYLWYGFGQVSAFGQQWNSYRESRRFGGRKAGHSTMTGETLTSYYPATESITPMVGPVAGLRTPSVDDDFSLESDRQGSSMSIDVSSVDLSAAALEATTKENSQQHSNGGVGGSSSMMITDSFDKTMTEEGLRPRYLKIAVAGLSFAVHVSDSEHWKLDDLFLQNVNTLLFETRGAVFEMEKSVREIASGLTWKQLKESSFTISNLCVRFLLIHQTIFAAECSSSLSSSSVMTSGVLPLSSDISASPVLGSAAAASSSSSSVPSSSKPSASSSSVSSRQTRYRWSQVMFDSSTMLKSAANLLSVRRFGLRLVTSVSLHRIGDTKLIFSRDKLFNSIKFSVQTEAIHGSFSLKQTHFIFTAISGLANLAEIMQVLIDEAVFGRSAMEWQMCFQNLRPKPSHKTPYDELMIQSVFRMQLTEARVHGLIVADSIAKEERESTFTCVVSKLTCDTLRNDVSRYLLKAPLNLDSKAPFLQLTCRLTPRVTGLILPPIIPIRRMKTSVLPSSDSGSVTCRTQSLGIVWDAVLHDMSAYLLLLSVEISSLLSEVRDELQRSSEDDISGTARRRGYFEDTRVKREGSPSTHVSSDEEGFMGTPRSIEASPSLITNNNDIDFETNSFRLLLSRSNVIHTDIVIEPLIHFWPLSYSFHFRSARLAASGITNPNNIVLKTPKISLKIGASMNEFTLSGMEVYSVRHSKSANSFDDLMKQTADYNGFSMLSKCWMRVEWKTVKAEAPMRKLSTSGTMLNYNVTCSPVMISLSTHQARCLSEVFESLKTRSFVPSDRARRKKRKADDFGRHSRRTPQLRDISKGIYMQQQRNKHAIPFTLDVCLPSVKCSLYPDCLSGEIREVNRFECEIIGVRVKADLNKQLSLTGWQASLTKATVRFFEGHIQEGMVHPSHQLCLINQISSFYLQTKQTLPKSQHQQSSSSSNMKLGHIHLDHHHHPHPHHPHPHGSSSTTTSSAKHGGRSKIRFVYLQLLCEPIQIIHNVYLLDKLTGLFDILRNKKKLTDLGGGYSKNLARSVSYLGLPSAVDSSTIGLVNGSSTRIGRSGSTQSEDGSVHSSVADERHLKLTEENLAKVDEMHHTDGDVPIPTDPRHLLTQSMLTASQLWVCVNLKGLHITFPGYHLKSSGTRGLAFQFSQLSLHSTHLNQLATVDFPTKYLSLESCHNCKSLFRRCSRSSSLASSVATTPVASGKKFESLLNESSDHLLLATDSSSSVEMKMTSQLRGFQVNIVSWPVPGLPADSTCISEVNWDDTSMYALKLPASEVSVSSVTPSAPLADAERREEEDKVSAVKGETEAEAEAEEAEGRATMKERPMERYGRDTLLQGVDIIMHLNAEHAPEEMKNSVNIDMNWSPLNIVVDPVQLAVVHAVLDSTTEPIGRGLSSHQSGNNVKSLQKKKEPSWFAKWEREINLSTFLPSMEIALNLSDSQMIRFCLSSIRSHHLYTEQKWHGHVRFDDCSAQYCDKDVFGAAHSHSSPLFKNRRRQKRRKKSKSTLMKSGDRDPHPPPPPPMTSSSMTMDDSNGVDCLGLKYCLLERRDKNVPAIYISYSKHPKPTFELNEIKEERISSAAADGLHSSPSHTPKRENELNVEIGGFDLIIPLNVVESASAAVSKLSRLSFLKDLRNEKQEKRSDFDSKSRRFMSGRDSFIPSAPQEKVIREVQQSIPSLYTTKVKFVLLDGSVAICDGLCSVHDYTRSVLNKYRRISKNLRRMWKINNEVSESDFEMALTAGPPIMSFYSSSAGDSSAAASSAAAAADSGAVGSTAFISAGLGGIPASLDFHGPLSSSVGGSRPSLDGAVPTIIETTSERSASESEEKNDGLSEPLERDDTSAVGTSVTAAAASSVATTTIQEEVPPTTSSTTTTTTRKSTSSGMFRGKGMSDACTPKTQSIEEKLLREQWKNYSEHVDCSVPSTLHCSCQNKRNPVQFEQSLSFRLEWKRVFMLSSPTSVVAGHGVATLTNSTRVDFADISVSLSDGESLKSGSLTPLFERFSASVCRSIQWRVATIADGSWPIGCPFEPVRKFHISSECLALTIEPRHLDTGMKLSNKLNLAFEQVVADVTTSDENRTTGSRSSSSFDTTSVSTTAASAAASAAAASSSATVAKKPSLKQQDSEISAEVIVFDDSMVDDPTYSSPPGTPLSTHHKHSTRSGMDWEDIDSDEAEDHFDPMDAGHLRHPSQSWSFSQASTSYTASQGRWFFQNDLHSMKRSEETDIEGRPLVNNIIFAESAFLSEPEMSADTTAEEMEERWMSWRYPSPRWVSHVSTGPILPLLMAALAALDDESEAPSVSMSGSINPPSVIHAFRSVSTADDLSSTAGAKRGSYSMSREFTFTNDSLGAAVDDLPQSVPNPGHGFMCFIGIHAWDSVLKKYVHIDSFYVDLDSTDAHKTYIHQLKRRIVADEWKVSWKLIPPQKFAMVTSLPSLPSSLELGKLLRVDSQLHVGPLLTQVECECAEVKIDICARNKHTDVLEKLMLWHCNRFGWTFGRWSTLEASNSGPRRTTGDFQALLVSAEKVNLQIPNYRDLTRYSVTNEFDISLLYRKNNVKMVVPKLFLPIEDTPISPVTLATVSTGHSSVNVNLSDVQLFFRRRLVFIWKYLWSSFSQNNNKTQSDKESSKNVSEWNSGDKQESWLAGSNESWFPCAEYSVQSHCQIPIWYGQIGSSHVCRLPVNGPIQSFVWTNCGEQKMRLSVDSGDHWSEGFEIDISDAAIVTKFEDGKTTESGLPTATTIAQTSVWHQKIRVPIRELSCFIIVKVEKKPNEHCIMVSLYPEYRVLNHLDVSLDIRIQFPRFTSILPSEVIDEPFRLGEREQRRLVIWRRDGRWKRPQWSQYKCQLSIKAVDNDSPMYDDPKINHDEEGSSEESDMKVDPWEGCQPIHLHTSVKNLPTMELVSLVPVPSDLIEKEKSVHFSILHRWPHAWFNLHLDSPFVTLHILPIAQLVNATSMTLHVYSSHLFDKNMVLRTVDDVEEYLSQDSTKQLLIASSSSSKTGSGSGSGLVSSFLKDKDKSSESKADESCALLKSEPPVTRVTAQLVRHRGLEVKSNGRVCVYSMPDLKKDKSEFMFVANDRGGYVGSCQIQPYAFGSKTLSEMSASSMDEKKSSDKSSRREAIISLSSEEGCFSFDVNMVDSKSGIITHNNHASALETSQSMEERDDPASMELSRPMLGPTGSEDSLVMDSCVHHLSLRQHSNTHFLSEIVVDHYINGDNSDDHYNSMNGGDIHHHHHHYGNDECNNDMTHFDDIEQKIFSGLTPEMLEQRLLSFGSGCAASMMKNSSKKHRKIGNWSPPMLRMTNLDLASCSLTLSLHSGYAIENMTEHNLILLATAELEESAEGEEKTSQMVAGSMGGGVSAASSAAAAASAVAGSAVGEYGAQSSVDSSMAGTDSDMFSDLLAIDAYTCVSALWSSQWALSFKIGVDIGTERHWSELYSLAAEDVLRKSQVRSADWCIRTPGQIFVFVIVLESNDLQSLKMSIRPKFVFHNKIGRSLLLLPLGMVDPTREDDYDRPDQSNTLVIGNNDLTGVSSWNVATETSEDPSLASKMVTAVLSSLSSSASTASLLNDDASSSKLSAAAVRVSFEDTEGDTHWDWSKALYILSQKKRRKHISVINRNLMYEDLITVVCICHQNVVHTLFFRCGQPPIIVKNQTNLPLNFSCVPPPRVSSSSAASLMTTAVAASSSSTSSSSKMKSSSLSSESGISHKIGPFRASAYDWREDIHLPHSASSSSGSSSHTRTKKEQSATATSTLSNQSDSWQVADSVYDRMETMVALQFAFEGSSKSASIPLQHGLVKTVMLEWDKHHEEESSVSSSAGPKAPITRFLEASSSCSSPTWLCVRVMIRRGTHIVEVLNAKSPKLPSSVSFHKRHASSSKPGWPSASPVMVTRTTTAKPRSFGVSSINVKFDSFSLRLETENARDIREHFNFYLTGVSVGYSRTTVEQWATPDLLGANTGGSKGNLTGYPGPLKMSHSADTDDGCLPASSDQLSCDLHMIGTSVYSQKSMNVLIDEIQIDDQSLKPEFPVLACFDPARVRKKNSTHHSKGGHSSMSGARDSKLSIAVVWNSPLNGQELEDLMIHESESFVARIVNAYNLEVETSSFSMIDHSKSGDGWFIDGLQPDSELEDYALDLIMVSVYIQPVLINTSDITLIKIHNLFRGALNVDLPSIIPYGMMNQTRMINNHRRKQLVLPGRLQWYDPMVCPIDGYKNWSTKARCLTGMNREIESVIRAAIKPRMSLQSLNISAITIRLSVSISEIPVFVGVGKAPLVLQAVSMSRVKCSTRRLIQELSTTYLADIFLRSPIVLGSLGLLGNPTHFVESVGSGFRDLVSIPTSALSDGPQAFFWGVGRGVIALAQHVGEGTLISVSSFSDSVSRNLERLAEEDLYSSARHRARSTTADSVSAGFASGMVSFSQSLLGGLSGVVSNPTRGLRDGAWGFIKGVGSGLVGAFTKPLSGALDLISATSKGLVSSAGPQSARKIVRCYPRVTNPYRLNSVHGFDYVAQIKFDVLLAHQLRLTDYRKYGITNFFMTGAFHSSAAAAAAAAAAHGGIASSSAVAGSSSSSASGSASSSAFGYSSAALSLRSSKSSSWNPEGWWSSWCLSSSSLFISSFMDVTIIRKVLKKKESKKLRKCSIIVSLKGLMIVEGNNDVISEVMDWPFVNSVTSHITQSNESVLDCLFLIDHPMQSSSYLSHASMVISNLSKPPSAMRSAKSSHHSRKRSQSCSMISTNLSSSSLLLSFNSMFTASGPCILQLEFNNNFQRQKFVNDCSFCKEMASSMLRIEHDEYIRLWQSFLDGNGRMKSILSQVQEMSTLVTHADHE